MTFRAVKIELKPVHQHGSALESLQGGEPYIPQDPAAFNTPFFSQITIKKLIQTLPPCQNEKLNI